MAQYGTSLSIDGYRPLNRASYSYISPGWVGSVGDVLVTPRLKQSAPDLPTRYEAWAAGDNAVFLGSNVQDGQHISQSSGGGPSRCIDSNWSGSRSFKTRRGWYMEDIRAPDNFVEPYVSSLGDYSWRNKVATVYDSLRTGENFLPVPGQYRLAPGQVPRGGLVPRVTDVNFGDTAANRLMSSAVLSSTAYTGQDFSTVPSRPLRRGITNQGGRKQPGKAK